MEFVIYAPRASLVGYELELRSALRSNGLPLGQVAIVILENGVSVGTVTTDVNGIVKFTPSEAGVYEFKGTKPGYSQYNRAFTEVLNAPSSAQLAGENPSPFTGLFTFASGNWPLILLALLLALAAYAYWNSRPR